MIELNHRGRAIGYGVGITVQIDVNNQAENRRDTDIRYARYAARRHLSSALWRVGNVLSQRSVTLLPALRESHRTRQYACLLLR